jgi:hypothetical protein
MKYLQEISDLFKALPKVGEYIETEKYVSFNDGVFSKAQNMFFWKNGSIEKEKYYDAMAHRDFLMCDICETPTRNKHEGRRSLCSDECIIHFKITRP